ncbi:MAG: methyltransferase domain-containing protein, partial [Myxococcota bacterium]
MSEPDLSAGEAWLSARTPIERKRWGQWPTPFDLCRAVVDRVAPRLPRQPRVVDPACGDGRWLLAAARRLPDADLIGVDRDPSAIDAARRTLDRAGVTATLHCADALLDDVVPDCDVVLGNPPYVRPQHLPRDEARALWRRFPAVTDKCDLSACFVALSCERAPRVAMVVGRSLLSLGSFGALRTRVRGHGLVGCFTVPDEAFDAGVSTMVLELGPEADHLTGAYRDGALTVAGTLHVTDEAWSLDGPLPALPGRPLGELVQFHMGVVCGDYARYVHRGPPGDLDRRTCRGRDVRRFRIVEGGEWIRYDPRDMLARKPYVAPKSAELFDVAAKVVVAGTTGRRLVAAMDEERRFPLDSCYIARPRRDDVDPWA